MRSRDRYVAPAFCIHDRIRALARRPTKPEGDNAEELKREIEKVTAKIDGAFEKLANKLRDKADASKAKLDGAKGKSKRATLLQRVELYTEGADHIESRYAGRREPS